MRNVLVSLCLFMAVLVGGYIWYTQPEPGWQQRLVSNLNDPESAQIRDVKISKVTGWICGQINSKNEMGGYVGFKVFRISDKE